MVALLELFLTLCLSSNLWEANLDGERAYLRAQQTLVCGSRTKRGHSNSRNRYYPVWYDDDSDVKNDGYDDVSLGIASTRLVQLSFPSVELHGKIIK